MARPDKLPKILTEEETDRLLSEPNQRYFGPCRDYLYMRLMLKAGLRASEATALQKEHVDLMSGKLSVREGKGAKDRTLWIGEEVLEELREWTNRRGEEAENSEFLLPTRKGTEVATSYLRRSVKRYARKAAIEEVDRVSPHTLRHTFATRLYRETGNIRMRPRSTSNPCLTTASRPKKSLSSSPEAPWRSRTANLSGEWSLSDQDVQPVLETGQMAT